MGQQLVDEAFIEVGELVAMVLIQLAQDLLRTPLLQFRQQIQLQQLP